MSPKFIPDKLPYTDRRHCLSDLVVSQTPQPNRAVERTRRKRTSIRTESSTLHITLMSTKRTNSHPRRRAPNVRGTTIRTCCDVFALWAELYRVHLPTMCQYRNSPSTADIPYSSSSIGRARGQKLADRVKFHVRHKSRVPIQDVKGLTVTHTPDSCRVVRSRLTAAINCSGNRRYKGPITIEYCL